MLINCPRCGFSQPNDQYCAQCGVNMQSFKPVQKSLTAKTFENLGVQVVILVTLATVAGSYIIQSDSSPKWVQKLTHFQGVTVSKTTPPISVKSVNETTTSTDATDPNELSDLNNQEIVLENNPEAVAAATSSQVTIADASAPTTLAKTSDSAARSSEANPNPDSSILFKLIFAEVSQDVFTRWVAESSRLGLFQRLPEYSAGILPDFRKRNDPIAQNLKTSEKKLTVGQNENHLAGTMGEDGQMIGLSVYYDFKTFENGSIAGSIQVTRAFQTRENFPAEFDLPRGSVFFMADSLNRMTLPPEQLQPSLAPFQIFKSADFMSQKSRFVIILEPVLK